MSEPLPLGHRVGRWEVIAEAPARKPKTGRFTVRQMLCRCACGGEYPVDTIQLRRGTTTQCRVCRYRNRTHTSSYRLWLRCRRNATVRGYCWRISLKHFMELYVAQGGRCAITGVPLVWAETAEELQTGVGTASLDRIDSKRGYVRGNVQWVHKTVNMLKGSLSDAELIHWARLIAAHADAKLHEYV